MWGMKKILYSGLLGTAVVLAIAGTGCVNTVTGRQTGGMPLMKDKVDGRYERPAKQVFEACKEVVRFNGTLVNEITRHSQTNAAILAIEGRIQDRKVFMAVKELEPRLSEVTVQVRTKMGSPDLDLAHELEKQVALKLAR